MIVKGTVDVLETSVDPETGKERTRVLVQMFDGHYFGELALIYGEPRNASVRATEEARIVLSCWFLVLRRLLCLVRGVNCLLRSPKRRLRRVR